MNCWCRDLYRSAGMKIGAGETMILHISPLLRSISPPDHSLGSAEEIDRILPISHQHCLQPEPFK